MSINPISEGSEAGVENQQPVMDRWDQLEGEILKLRKGEDARLYSLNARC